METVATLTPKNGATDVWVVQNGALASPFSTTTTTTSSSSSSLASWLPANVEFRPDDAWDDAHHYRQARPAPNYASSSLSPPPPTSAASAASAAAACAAAACATATAGLGDPTRAWCGGRHACPGGCCRCGLRAWRRQRRCSWAPWSTWGLSGPPPPPPGSSSTGGSIDRSTRRQWLTIMSQIIIRL